MENSFIVNTLIFIIVLLIVLVVMIYFNKRITERNKIKKAAEQKRSQIIFDQVLKQVEPVFLHWSTVEEWQVQTCTCTKCGWKGKLKESFISKRPPVGNEKIPSMELIVEGIHYICPNCHSEDITIIKK
jgi:Zn finger protein HypA/HybF involved in hydrogenase expression